MRLSAPCNRWFCGIVASGIVASIAMADTTLTGAGTAAFALKSSGTTSGTSATLSQDGYVGTYVNLAAPGAISFSINASGGISNTVASDMTVSIADYSKSFSVSSATAGNYTYTSPVMPAGTYFVRTQLDNHKTVLIGSTPVSAATTLTVNSMTVSGNATVLNSSTDANAIAAANTYIDNFRKGNATVALPGVSAGTQAQVRLKSNAFQLGTYVPGGFSSTDNYLATNASTGSDAANFQSFIKGQFNAIVPSNAGKWAQNETFTTVGGVTSSTVNMSSVDQMMAYAAANGMSARQHNLIWGSQQPTQIKTYLTNAASTSLTSAVRAANVTALKSAIANRIAYYIAGANTVDGKARAADFQQLDVLNEALQTGNYMSVLGYSGVASIYQQAQAAVTAANLTTKLYTNEYNVFQNSPISVTPSATYGTQAAATYGDQYANWYLNEVESLNNAGLANGAKGNVVTGIGAQYYPTVTGAKGPSVIQSAVQNLSVAGLPISMTEFGGQTSITASAAPQLVDDTIRMMMGTPNVTTMMMWGWYDDGTASTNPYGGGTVLVNKGWKNADGTWNLTAAGKRFEYLFGMGLDPTAPGANPDGSNPDPLTTNLTATVNADGTINFNGFYGDYVITINGKDYDLLLNKGADNSALILSVPEPAAVTMLSVAVISTGRRRREVRAG